MEEKHIGDGIEFLVEGFVGGILNLVFGFLGGLFSLLGSFFMLGPLSRF
jgi:hypothetical protein